MSIIGEGSHAVPQIPVQSLLYQPPKSVLQPAEVNQQETHRGSNQPSERDIGKLISDINLQLQAMHTELNFSIDKETERMVLKIINAETDEVIRQIPAEEALRIASRLSKLLGLLVDHSA